jgi:hypothetical protein
MTTPDADRSEPAAAEASARSWRVDPVYSHSMADLLTPGVIVEVSAEEAESWGAFEETALDEADAWEAIDDHGDAPGENADV